MSYLQHLKGEHHRLVVETQLAVTHLLSSITRDVFSCSCHWNAIRQISAILLQAMAVLLMHPQTAPQHTTSSSPESGTLRILQHFTSGPLPLREMVIHQGQLVPELLHFAGLQAVLNVESNESDAEKQASAEQCLSAWRSIIRLSVLQSGREAVLLAAPDLENQMLMMQSTETQQNQSPLHRISIQHCACELLLNLVPHPSARPAFLCLQQLQMLFPCAQDRLETASLSASHNTSHHFRMQIAVHLCRTAPGRPDTAAQTADVAGWCA